MLGLWVCRVEIEGKMSRTGNRERVMDIAYNCCSFLIAFACIRVCNVWHMASGVDVLLFMNRRAVALAMVARGEVRLFHYEGLVEHMNNKVQIKRGRMKGKLAEEEQKKRSKGRLSSE